MTQPFLGQIQPYGFGFAPRNWALCNARRDGRWCGVNDELGVLRRTGCYADFTLPSATGEPVTRRKRKGPRHSINV